MELTNEHKDNTPIIFTIGLSQMYYINTHNLVYDDFTKEIFTFLNEKESEKNLFEKIQNKNNEYLNKNKPLSYLDFKKELSSIIKFESLVEYFDDFVKKRVVYLDKEQIETVKLMEINIYNENPFYLLIDEICLLNFQKENNIKINFYIQNELISDSDSNVINNYIKLNKKIFFYANYPETIKLFKKKFPSNFFTFLYGIYLFTFNDKKVGSEEYKIVTAIKNYFENELNTNHNIYNDSQYIINSNINFLVHNFYCLNYYHKIIISKNISTYEDLVKYFEQSKPRVVLIFIKSLLKDESFIKQRFFISDGDIIYKPHYGGLDARCNGRVDTVLPKASEMKDLEEYSDIFDFIKQNYITINDINNFPSFINKNAQSLFLQNFCNLINNNDLNNEYSEFKLSIVKNFKIDFDILKNKKKFLESLKQNQLDFPIIIKYSSNHPKFKHLMSIIMNEKCFENFIDEYISPIDNTNYKTNCLIQSIINHGGYVLKIYFMGGKIFIDYRSSIIDMEEKNTNLMESIFQGKGYWSFKTVELESENYKKNIWEKYVKKDNVYNLVNDNQKLKKYLYQITNLFEIYSHMSLFGIDVLIDYNNKNLYIIDANSFPGYKKGYDIKNDIREFFKKYTNKK